MVNYFLKRIVKNVEKAASDECTHPHPWTQIHPLFHLLCSSLGTTWHPNSSLEEMVFEYAARNDVSCGYKRHNSLQIFRMFKHLIYLLSRPGAFTKNTSVSNNKKDMQTIQLKQLRKYGLETICSYGGGNGGNKLVRYFRHL